MMDNRSHHKRFYFSISQGLRGCYMPDSSYILSVKTRKELKQALESEAYYIRDAGFIGCSRKAIAWLSAVCWKNRAKSTLDFVSPYRDRSANRKTEYPYGLFCSSASASDYRDYCKENR